MTMKSKTARKGDAKTAALVFLFFLAVYAATAAPEIMFEDSGEFALSSYTLGVSHPPGYPLYNLLGRLFQFLPAGAPGFRINLMSAFFGALGMAVLFAAARELGFSRFSSAVGVAACGLSRTLWSQAAIDEVYTLNVFLNAALIWGVARLRAGDRRMPLALAMLLGLTAANHYTTLAAFVPLVFAAALSVEGFRPRKWIGRLAAGAFAAFAPVALYMLLPLRAAAGPLLNWRNPQTWQAFMLHVERTQFQQWEAQIGFHLPTLMKFMANFFRNLPVEFYGVFIFFAVLGLARLISERKRLAAGLGWLWLVQSLGILLAIRFQADDALMSVVRVFYFGAYLVTGIFIAAGVEGLLAQIAGQGGGRRKLAAAAAVAIAACLIVPLARHYRANDLSADTRFERFGVDMFRYLPRDAVYYMQGSHFTSPTIYWQTARNLRADVVPIDGTGNLVRENIEKVYGPFEWINLDTVINQVVAYYSGRNEQAFSYPRTFESAARAFELRGPFFYLAAAAGCDPLGWNPDSYGFTPASVAGRDNETRMFGPILEARRAECEFLKNNTESGKYYVKRAVEALPGSAYVTLFAGQLLERYGQRNEAMEYYQKTIDLNQYFTDAWLQLGGMMVDGGEMKAAEIYYRRALRITPGLEPARLALANIAERENNYNRAIEIYKGLVADNPRAIVYLNNLANAYLKLRRINDAEKLFARAQAIDPDSQFTAINYSDFLMEMGRNDEAKTVLERFIAVHPGIASAYYNLAIACHRSGNLNSAVLNYRKAVEADPAMQEAWINLVMLLLDRNMIAEARETAEDMQRKVGEDLALQAFLLYLRVEKTAVERNQADAQAWSNLVLGMLQIGQVEKARQIVRELKEAKIAALGNLPEQLDKAVESFAKARKN